MEKSKYLNIHSTYVRLYRTLWETKKDTDPVFEGTVSYKSDTFGVVEAKDHTFWLPAS